MTSLSLVQSHPITPITLVGNSGAEVRNRKMGGQLTKAILLSNAKHV